MSKQEADLIDRSVMGIENLMTVMPMRKISKVLKIDKWHPASQTFLYFFIVGAILLVLHLFNLMPWGVLWIYALFIIVMWGFMFTKPTSRFNIVLVLMIFLILMFVPSRACQMLLDVTWSEENPLEFSGLFGEIQNLTADPFDVDSMVYFMNTVNWIVFLFFVGYGISVVGDVISFQWGKVAQKAAIIALAMLVMGAISGMMDMAGIEIITVWDTLGGTWDTFLENVGLASLDITDPRTIGVTVNGMYSLIPVIIVVANLSFAIYFRKKAFHSILFARGIMEEETIEVKRSTFSTPTLVILIGMIIYIVGYNLMTANPVLIVDPIITLTFYISSGLILILIGLKVIIINKDRGTGSFIKSFLKWTVFGLMGLFLYFQALQPALYEMGVISEQSGLLSIGENSVLLGNDALNQLFIVATPETLIFQVAITGISNRIYFRLRKGTLIQREMKRLTKKKEQLQNKLEVITITESTSKANLRNLAKRAVIRKEIDKIDKQLEEGKVTKLPFSYFIIPTLVASLFASFLFSDYHRFRRGMDFASWWQNYMFGLTYMGAGFFLNLVALFNWLSAIIVHWLNNLIAMMVVA